MAHALFQLIASHAVSDARGLSLRVDRVLESTQQRLLNPAGKVLDGSET